MKREHLKQYNSEENEKRKRTSNLTNLKMKRRICTKDNSEKETIERTKTILEKDNSGKAKSEKGQLWEGRI